MKEIIWSPSVIFDGVELSEDHKYKLNGKAIPGLTYILERAGLSNYDGIPQGVLEAKAKFGSRVHQYCHWFDEDDLDLEDLKQYEDYYFRVFGWKQFREDFQFTPLFIERPIAIKIAGMTFGCTPDRYGYGAIGANGDEALGTVELKTTVDVEYSAHVQTAGQGVAITTPDNPIPPRLIVQLLDSPNQAGKFYNVTFCTDHLDLKVMTAALILEYTKINHKLK